MRRLFVPGYYSGFSNNKMSLDIAIALAHLTGRTLVPYRFRLPRRAQVDAPPDCAVGPMLVPDRRRSANLVCLLLLCESPSLHRRGTQSVRYLGQYRSSPIGVDPACLMENSKLVAVVHRATPNELGDQRGLSCMAASRDDDGPPSPPDHTRMSA